MTDKIHLNDETLEQASGGTLNANLHSERVYNNWGIKTDYHLVGKDEFFLWSDVQNTWVPITYDEANLVVALGNDYARRIDKFTYESYQRLLEEKEKYPYLFE